MCACACVSFLAMFVESHWKLPGWQDRDSLKKLLEEEAERERFAEESHGDRWSDIRWGHQGIDIWQLWQLWQLWQVWQVAVGSNVSLMVSAGRCREVKWNRMEKWRRKYLNNFPHCAEFEMFCFVSALPNSV